MAVAYMSLNHDRESVEAAMQSGFSASRVASEAASFSLPALMVMSPVTLLVTPSVTVPAPSFVIAWTPITQIKAASRKLGESLEPQLSQQFQKSLSTSHSANSKPVLA